MAEEDDKRDERMEQLLDQYSSHLFEDEDADLNGEEMSELVDKMMEETRKLRGADGRESPSVVPAPIINFRPLLAAAAAIALICAVVSLPRGPGITEFAVVLVEPADAEKIGVFRGVNDTIDWTKAIRAGLESSATELDNSDDGRLDIRRVTPDRAPRDPAALIPESTSEGYAIVVTIEIIEKTSIGALIVLFDTRGEAPRKLGERTVLLTGSKAIADEIAAATSQLVREIKE